MYTSIHFANFVVICYNADKGGFVMNKGGFSLSRLLGISGAKQKVAKTTGIPTTKQGRQRKVDRTVRKGLFGK